MQNQYMDRLDKIIEIMKPISEYFEQELLEKLSPEEKELRIIEGNNKVTRSLPEGELRNRRIELARSIIKNLNKEL